MYQPGFLYTLCVVVHVFSIPFTWAKITLPAQLGPHPVHIQDYLLHTNRLDPWAPQKELRELMLTIYKPNTASSHCSNPSLIDYMPARVAAIFDESSSDYMPNGTYEKLQLRSCAASYTSSKWWKDTPLLLFSPGLGGTRLEYSAIMVAVASSGYTVVSVDHTYAPAAVELGHNGRIAIGNQEGRINSSDWDSAYAVMQSMMPVQAADLGNVLGAIKAGKLPGLPKYTDNIQAGIFGHSLGGATAAVVLAEDPRFVAGVNYDAPMSKKSGNEGFSKPWLVLDEAYILTGSDESQEDLWSHLTGWKSLIAINGTVHTTFSDLPLFGKLLDLRKAVNETVYDEWYGSIDGQRALEILWKYTVSFFDFVLKDKSPYLLQHNSTRYPEAVFLKGDFHR